MRVLSSMLGALALLFVTSTAGAAVIIIKYHPVNGSETGDDSGGDGTAGLLPDRPTLNLPTLGVAPKAPPRGGTSPHHLDGDEQGSETGDTSGDEGASGDGVDDVVAPLPSALFATQHHALSADEARSLDEAALVEGDDGQGGCGGGPSSEAAGSLGLLGFVGALRRWRRRTARA